MLDCARTNMLDLCGLRLTMITDMLDQRGQECWNALSDMLDFALMIADNWKAV